MPKTFHSTMPRGFSACIHHDCPIANTCLHQIAYDQIAVERDYIHIVNPTKCTKDASCRFYRNNKPVMYAKGFTGMQKRMFPGQYEKFKLRLIEALGRTPFYNRRNGTTPLSPHEQEIVVKTLKEVGVMEELKFDYYMEGLNWYD